jgi:hypothetical protein
VRFTGSFHPSASQPAGTVGTTFAIYGQQEGGAPLWTEDQNVELDVSGNYTVLLGSTKNEGVPPELFAGGEARWLQVELYVPGEVDAPRVLLVSVPYALKAADADTLGGKPASSYLLAGSSTLAPPAQSVNSVSAMAATVVEPATTTINLLARPAPWVTPRSTRTAATSALVRLRPLQSWRSMAMYKWTAAAYSRAAACH